MGQESFLAPFVVGSEIWLEYHHAGIMLIVELKRHKKDVMEILGDSTPRESQAWLTPLAAVRGVSMEAIGSSSKDLARKSYFSGPQTDRNG